MSLSSYGVLEMVLVLRFFFRLLGASQNTSVMLFPYHLSQMFVAPFQGIFHDQALGARSVFELSTLIAMLVFALLAWGLVALSYVVFAPNDSGRQRAMSIQADSMRRSVADQAIKIVDEESERYLGIVSRKGCAL